MIAADQYIQQNRAALFDWLVLSISFLLSFIFPTLSDFFQSPGYYNWMLVSLLLYVSGAALKHLPLSYRLTLSPKTLKPVPYLLFLLIGHWFILLIIILFSEPGMRLLLGLPALEKDITSNGWMMVAATAAAFFITWLVYRTKSKRTIQKKYSAAFLFRMESVADIFLIVAVSIFSFVFWEKGVMGMLSKASAQTIGDIWFLFIFLSIMFLFFYLPLRYLYFIEYREGSSNSRRLFLIFGFILLKALFELLAI